MDRNNRLLIDGYFDGELTGNETQRLARLLATDTSSLDRFVIQGFIHSQLLDWMSQQRVRDQAVVSDLSGNGAALGQIRWPLPVSPDCIPQPPAPQRAKTEPVRRLRSLLLAAAVMIAVGLTIHFVAATRPVIVGVLTEATNCRWNDSHDDVPVGTLLHNGQELTLLQGNAVITLASGAQLLLEGPVAVRLDSAMEVRLHDGRIAAKVPRHALGFTVSSSLSRFVDLGTQFTLSLEAEKSFELHVFEGLVELWLDRRFGEAARWPVRVAEVRAVSFNVERGDVEKLDFPEGLPMPF